MEVITGLLTQETTTFDGRYFKLDAARNNPAGIQTPHPPICIGGRGERRTLPAVARWAQHWNYPGPGGEEFAATKQKLDLACAEIGRDPAEITTSIHVRYDPDAGPVAAAEEAAAQADLGVDLVIFYLPSPHHAAVLGPLAEAIDAL